MIESLEQLLGTDWQSALIIVLNLILIESLLSVDNAAVLATMVIDLPEPQRALALRYGIIGAYVFRGLSLYFAAWLIQIWWLKPLGGLYLLYLAYDFFQSRNTPETTDDTLNKRDKWFYRYTLGWMGPFWSTIVAVEVMDMAFSIDNVFAAVAFTDSIVLICTGVFIGILAMRFVAQWFVRLIERYPVLEVSAFAVIALLGLKLLVAIPVHYFPHLDWLENETTDLVISVVTAAFFFIPVLFDRFITQKKG